MSELSDWKRDVLPGLLEEARKRGRAEGAALAKLEERKKFQRIVGDPRVTVQVSKTSTP